jgi:CIC family chloride channel protein
VGLARALGLPARFVRGMIPVGTAAGIAAIFNTPITGVVFALEEVIGTASRGVLGGAIVAAVAAAVVQKQAMGGQHILPASPASWSGVHELVGFAVLGLLSGALAGWLPRVVVIIRRRLDALGAGRGARSPVLRGAVVGLGVGALGAVVPEIMGVGYPVISDWLTGAGASDTAALGFAAKFLAVALALAAPLVGGVFAPSLFLGASLGAAAGHLLRLLDPTGSIDPGAYALVGMGAFFGGFLRTPIASVLIVFELTGDYGLVAPLMLAVALSTLVARRITPITLADHQLAQEGVALHGSDDPLAQHRARDVMSTPAVALETGMSLGDARAKVGERRHRQYPVVAPDGLCVGTISGSVLFGSEDDAVPLTARLAEPTFLALADEPLDRLSLRMGAARITRCPVVESAALPRLVGFIAPSDMLRARVRSAADHAGEMEPLG